MNARLILPLLLATSSLGALAANGSLIDLKVEDRGGRDYREYRAQGRNWVAGEDGEPYQLRLSNRSSERVLVVLSVDGVNAVSGQTAGYKQSGYVLEPGQETVVAGWRKSLDNIARFYFTDLGDSYAARTGRPDDVGVIGAAVFREKVRYQPPAIAYGQASKARPPMSGMRAESQAAPAPSLGTGHGEIEDSYARRTEFERASSSPAETLAIRYDSRRNLLAAGVISSPRRRDEPNPFPQQGFTPDPPRYGWNNR